MLTGIRNQHFAAGFAQGLFKCANAAQALEDAARVVVNPATKRTMAALGQDIFEAATKAENPFSAFHKFMLGNPRQVNAIGSAMKNYASLINGAAPEVRSALEAQRDALLHDQFAELGTAASSRLRFMNKAIPAAGAVGITAPIAYAGGDISGHLQQADRDRDDTLNLPIHKRIQYALFPQTVVPQPSPYYDRIHG